MKAFFFDRDRTLNIDPGYIKDPADMSLYRGVPGVLKYLKSLGYLIFIISNQSGIGRAKIKPDEFRRVNEKFLSLCGGYDIISDIFYCLHAPEQNCRCRKPETLFIDMAKERYDIDCRKSYIAGDKMSDILTGHKSGMKTILVLNGILLKDVPHINDYKDVRPDYVLNSVSELKKIIKK